MSNPDPGSRYTLLGIVTLAIIIMLGFGLYHLIPSRDATSAGTVPRVRQ